MKKHLLSLLLAGCAWGSGFLSAQPTLTASGMNPVVGNQVISSNAQYVAPGSGGASQTWNLGFTPGGTATSNAVAPSTTPYASSFTNSNVAWSGGGTYSYYNATSSALTYTGVVNGSGTVIAYNNTEDHLRYPMAYTNTYTDSWSAQFVQATYTYYRWGTTTVTADGWGTLTTPAGTFTNVMRVHFVQSYQDSVNIMSTPMVITYNNDQYMWYLNGNHFPIASVYDFTSSAGSPFQGGYYVTNVVSGISESLLASSLAVYPNPANEIAILSLSSDDVQELSVVVSDLNGRAVMTKPVYVIPGENKIELETGELAEGVYIISVSGFAGVVTSRRLIISH